MAATLAPETLPSPPESGRTWRPVVAGALAALAALGVSELIAGIWEAESSLVVAVGDLVIDLAPPAVEDFGISVFGTNDKPALIIGIVVLSAVFGAVLGRYAAVRLWLGIAGFGGFGLLGLWAALRSPFLSTAFAIVAASLATAAGVVVLAALLRAADVRTDVGAAAGRDRRMFLVGAGAVAGLAGIAALGGRRLLAQARRVVAAGREDVVLPAVPQPASPPGPGSSFDVPGLSDVVTPNNRFYRIDTALVTPRVNPMDWELAVTGMVDRPFSLNFAQLLDMPMVERYVTLSCVSNRVGGGLVGNALWLGIPLEEILDRAGVQPDATQIVGRSVDDFTVGFPTEVARDGREALLAVGMNGEPLPFDHGFPARLVVAGLYGYVSATKWLREIELTRLEDFDAYWIPRGWAKEAPIKTQSRIDVPARGSAVGAGDVAVAGVAWAPTRGISRVEVRVGDGEWQEARVSAPLSEDSWVQWRFDWQDAPVGVHTLMVRATDGDGVTQTAAESPPRPDGATGYHTIDVRVRDA